MHCQAEAEQTLPFAKTETLTAKIITQTIITEDNIKPMIEVEMEFSVSKF